MLATFPALSQDFTYTLETIIGAEVEGIVPASSYSFTSHLKALAVGPNGSIRVLDDPFMRSMTLARIDRDGTARTVFLRGVRPFCSTAGRTFSITRTNTFALGPDGSIYVARSFCEQVFRISPDGEVTHFAGNSYGYSVDNIPVKDVRFAEIRDIACDKDGNVYVLDVSRVRRIGKDGQVTLYAGGGAALGEGIDAAGSGFNNPTSMTFDSVGNLFVSDLRTGLIRKITPQGKIFTFTRFKTDPFGLWRIRAMPSGSLAALSTSGKLVRIDPDGKETMLASSEITWPDLVVTPDGDAIFQSSGGIISAVDARGNVRPLAGTPKSPAQSGKPKFEKIPALSGVTLGGQGLWFTSFSSLFLLTTPGELLTLINGWTWMGTPLFHQNGDLYFQAARNVWRLDSSEDGKRKHVAGPSGLPIMGYGGDGGPASNAVLGAVEGLAIDPKGDLLIANAPTVIRKVDARLGTIDRLYGTLAAGDSGDGGMAANASFRYISGMAFDRFGNLYVSDKLAHRIRKIDPSGRISAFAGTGVAGSTGDGGPAANARVSSPASVATDPMGNVYFSENPPRIRVIDTQGTIRTIAGTGESYPYSFDGTPGLRANLADPQRLFVAPTGAVYFTDGSWIGGDGIYLRRLNPENTRFPRVTTNGLVHGATGEPGTVAPGMIAVVYGTSLGPPNLAGAALVGGELSRRIGGTAVFFDSTPAPILYSSVGQLGLIVPYSVAGKQKVTVKVETVGAFGPQSIPFEVDVAPTRPGLFTADNSGRGPAVAVNQDGTFNSAANPAGVDTIVAFYGTGEGQTSPAGADGRMAAGTLPKPTAPLSLQICGQTAQIVYSGAAPQASAGLLQVNARVPPACVGTGAASVVLTVGAASSPPVILFVR